jgi:hypothetical protein
VFVSSPDLRWGRVILVAADDAPDLVPLMKRR